MECTKVNCPMQAGTPTDNCGENCLWKTTAKIGDLISRTAAIEAIKPLLYSDNCVSTLINMPAVDAVPVVHGWWSEKRWMTDDDWGVINHRAIVCSACKGEIADGEQTRYCPNCGAKMDVTQTTTNTNNPLSAVKISKPTYRLEYPC